MEIATWEYEDGDGDGAGTTHIGPVAEELATRDERIGELETTVETHEAELAESDERVDDLERENAQLRNRLAAVEAHLGLASEHAETGRAD